MAGSSRAQRRERGAKTRSGSARAPSAQRFAWLSRQMARWRGLSPRQWLTGIALLLAVLALTPVMLLVLYRFVDPVSVPILADRLSGVPVTQRWVRLEDVARPVVWSLIASEDQRFCLHGGVDWAALGDQIERWQAGEEARGASTLTMQVVKNLFFGTARSYLRKGLEVPLAFLADIIIGKRRILEIYLNIAEWGRGIYGIEAAGLAHFGQPASTLNLRQAARLVSALPNPRERDPARPTSAHARLAGIIEARAPQMGAYVACLEPGRNG